jgi:metal-sulfur cluster biosynthetic enzyme
VDSGLVKSVSEKLAELVDEETRRKFGELNIITDIAEGSDGSITVRFQPLSPYSPLAVEMGRSIKRTALSVEGVKSVRVECTGHMMDDLVNRLVNGDTHQ